MYYVYVTGASPGVVVSRVRGSFPGLSGSKVTKLFLPYPLIKLSIVGSLCDPEAARSASDSQGLNFESCVYRAVSSHSSHHPQEVLLAQFSICVQKSGLKPDSFYLYVYVTGTLYIVINATETCLWIYRNYSSQE